MNDKCKVLTKWFHFILYFYNLFDPCNFHSFLYLLSHTFLYNISYRNICFSVVKIYHLAWIWSEQRRSFVPRHKGIYVLPPARSIGLDRFGWNSVMMYTYCHWAYSNIYIQQDATLHSLFYLETALHVLGGTYTQHHTVTATCSYSGR